MTFNRRTVALVTSYRLDQRGWSDSDTPLVHKALDERNVHAELVAWHDETVDWSSYDIAVLRSPWDLFLGNLDEFFTWIDKVALQTTVLNAPSVCRRVLDKHYLNDLTNAGIPVIPTEFVEIGQSAKFPDVEFVVKPATSGAATNTARYRPNEISAATKHIEFIHSQGVAAMVQPYMTSIDSEEERALMFFNGTYDHAIAKQAILKLDENFAVVRKLHPGPHAYEPTAVERSIADAALNVMASRDELLSGRVDMVLDSNGDPAIMELELIAPVIFLTHSHGAIDRFADAICERLKV